VTFMPNHPLEDPPSVVDRVALAFVRLAHAVRRVVRWALVAAVTIAALHYGLQPVAVPWVMHLLRARSAPSDLGPLLVLAEVAIGIEMGYGFDGFREDARKRKLSARPAPPGGKAATIATLDAARARREKRAQEREDRRSADALLRAAAKLDAAAQTLVAPKPAPVPAPVPVAAPKPEPEPGSAPAPSPDPLPPTPAPAPPREPKPAKVKPVKPPKAPKEPKPVKEQKPKEQKPKEPKPASERKPLRSRLHRRPKEPQPTVAWDHVKLVGGKYLAVLLTGSTQRRIVAADLDTLEAAAHEGLLSAVRTGAWPARALVGRELREAWEANSTTKEIVS
jgi:hypothetical protein